MFAKLAQAKTVEDVLAVAKECGKEISEEEAKKTLEEISATKKSGELSDDDLDNVAGGYTQEEEEYIRKRAQEISEAMRRLFPYGY